MWLSAFTHVLPYQDFLAGRRFVKDGDRGVMRSDGLQGSSAINPMNRSD